MRHYTGPRRNGFSESFIVPALIQMQKLFSELSLIIGKCICYTFYLPVFYMGFCGFCFA
jgi:hypothetical protein